MPAPPALALEETEGGAEVVVVVGLESTSNARFPTHAKAKALKEPSSAGR